MKEKTEKLSVVDSFCKGCLFLGRSHSSAPASDCCDFILIAGISRHCPAGTGCEKKKLINGNARRAAIKRLSTY